MAAILKAPTGRMAYVVDALIGLWVVVWVVTGVLVARNVYELRQVSDTLATASQALDETAEGLDNLSGLPFVGDRLGNIADRIAATAQSVADDARQTEESVSRLSYLLGIVVVLIPSVPILASYVPYRISRIRERHAVMQAVDAAAADGAGSDERVAVQEYLARRAVANLPYHVLRDVTTNPWADLRAGRFDRLARAELERLGVESDIARRLGRQVGAEVPQG